MKKIISILLLLIITAITLTVCHGGETGDLPALAAQEYSGLCAHYGENAVCKFY